MSTRKKTLEIDSGMKGGLDAFMVGKSGPTPKTEGAAEKPNAPGRSIPPKAAKTKAASAVPRETPAKLEVKTTRVTVQLTEEVAGLIDEVYGRKKLLEGKQAGKKYEFFSSILKPALEKEKKRLLKLEIDALETRKRELEGLG